MRDVKKMIFAGTPAFAAVALDALVNAGYDIVLVLTQPDRPAGRGMRPQASAVKQHALKYQLPLAQPTTLKETGIQAQLRALNADVMIVAAYGLILPQAVLDMPKRGCLNIHASLLPRWRGAAPIQRAILAGDAESGVDLMEMEAGLDTGPVLLERRTPITGEDTGGSLHDRLSMLGADVLAEGLARAMTGETLVAQAQPDEGVTYAHKLDKAEARLDFTRPAIELERQVRAFDPWPVAEGDVAGETLRIWAARAIEGSGAPGSVLGMSREGIDIACGEGALRVTALQRAGGKRITAGDYCNAMKTRGA